MSTQHGVITLKTISPVFVGSEEELGIKEYYLDNKMSKVYILDGSSFFHL